MKTFLEWVINEYEKFDEKKHRWITIKDKQMQNQHIMLNKKDGTIEAGMGGKHNGDTLDDVYNDKKDSKKSSKTASNTAAAKIAKSKTKKPTKKQIKDSISDASMLELQHATEAAISLARPGGGRSLIYKSLNKANHEFGELPYKVRTAYTEEFENIKKDLKKFRQSASDMKDLYYLSQNIKNDRKLSSEEKQLLDKAIEAGGIDKLIDTYSQQYKDIKSSLFSFTKKCEKMKRQV